MEQALASDMWGTPHFRMAYREMAKKFYELTDGLEWETSLFEDLGKPCEQLYYWGPWGFDVSSAVFSALDTLGMVVDEYRGMSRDVEFNTLARWGSILLLLENFCNRWRIE